MTKLKNKTSPLPMCIYKKQDTKILDINEIAYTSLVF